VAQALLLPFCFWISFVQKMSLNKIKDLVPILDSRKYPNKISHLLRDNFWPKGIQQQNGGSKACAACSTVLFYFLSLLKWIVLNNWVVSFGTRDISNAANDPWASVAVAEWVQMGNSNGASAIHSAVVTNSAGDLVRVDNAVSSSKAAVNAPHIVVFLRYMGWGWTKRALVVLYL
jgi:hypothetical protein